MEVSNEKCERCEDYIILNSRHIVNGKPIKSCASGNHPDSCKPLDKK